MRRKTTFLRTAIIVLFLILFTQPGTAWGQTRTAILTSDLDLGTPIVSENFNSLSLVDKTEKSTYSTSQTAYGVFNSIYNNQTYNHYAIVNDNDVFDSKVMRLSCGGGSPIITQITGQTFGTSGVLPLR